MIVLACLLTVVPPLIDDCAWSIGFDNDFSEMRIINDELKFVIFLLFASRLVGVLLAFNEHLGHSSFSALNAGKSLI